MTSLHLGLHWGMVLNAAAKKNIRLHQYQAVGSAAGLLIAAYGIYAFIKREFLTYMFLHSEFVFLDYEESKPLLFSDYLALMGLCIFVTHYSAKLVKRWERDDD